MYCAVVELAALTSTFCRRASCCREELDSLVGELSLREPLDH